MAGAPPLPASAEGTRGRLLAPLSASAGVILASTIAWRVSLSGAVVPGCRLRQWLGVPCPGCGGTHCLAAWAHGDVVNAIRWNPLISLVIVAIGVWLAAAMCDALFSTPFLRRMESIARPAPKGRIAWTFAALNMIYLWLTLPT